MRLPAWLLALALALAPVCALAQNPLLLGVGQVSASGCAYSTEACTLFAAMTSAPNSTRKGLINTAIVCLKSASVWTKEDWLVVMAAGNQHDGLLNWANPAKTLSVVGAASIATDLGATNGGASTSNYLLMPEVLNAAGNNYAQDNAHFSGYFNAFAFAPFGSLITDGGTNYNSSLGQYDSTNAFFGGINNGTPSVPTTGVDATASHFLGMWTASRTGAATSALYKSGSAVNGVNSWTSAAASVAVALTAPKLLWGDGSFAYGPPSATTRMAVYSTGTSFSSTDASNEASCLTTYLTAIGAS